MDELTATTKQLPDTLEDLTQFVLVNKARLQAYMLKLKTVEKLDTAQAIKDQTLRDSQEIASALLAAEQRIGELLLAIPKATPNNNPFHENRDASNFVKSKSETIKEQGYSKDEASQYQQMAKNPEIVRKVIEEALANGEVPTKSEVTKNIKYQKQLEAIEQKAPESVKRQVRSGEKTINQAWLDLKKQERKNTEKQEKSSLSNAEDRHTEFQQKKQDKVVSLTDIRQDKEDQAKIADSLFWEISKTFNSVAVLGAMITTGDKDIKPLKLIDEDKKQILKDAINGTREAIIRIQEVII